MRSLFYISVFRLWKERFFFLPSHTWKNTFDHQHPNSYSLCLQSVSALRSRGYSERNCWSVTDSHLCVAGKRGVLKRPWSEAERAAVEEHLTQNINELRVPAKADCERCLQQCPLLVNNQRDWRAIKFYCHNRIQLLKKNMRRESEPQPLTVCWAQGCLSINSRAANQISISNGTLLPLKHRSFES